MRQVVLGKLVEHVARLTVDDRLSRLAAATAAVLGLNRQYRVQYLLGRVTLVPVVMGEQYLSVSNRLRQQERDYKRHPFINVHTCIMYVNQAQILC